MGRDCNPAKKAFGNPSHSRSLVCLTSAHNTVLHEKKQRTMNLIALLHPSARRSVFSLSAQRIAFGTSAASDDASRPTSATTRPRTRRHRRPQSKNCKTQRKQQQAGRSLPKLPLLDTERAADDNSGEQETALETDLERMRRQIGALDRRLTLLDSVALVSRQNAQAAALQMMEQYHQFTCRGFAMFDEPTTTFMRSLFVEDVRSPDFTGLAVFMQQWEHLSVYHASLSVETKGLDVLPTETLADGSGRYSDDVYMIKSFGTTTCRISRKTIECIFPQVLHDEPLVQWLIGKQYACSYTLVVHVNSEGRIFQLESKVDLTSALLDLLHDPFVTLKLVEASTMTSSGNLQLHNSGVREAQNTIENGFL